MKKMKVFFCIMVILIMSTTLFGQVRRQPYENTISWEMLIDTTAAITYDTQSTVFNFTGLYNRKTVDGFIYVQVTTLDTGASAAVAIDTSKDSMKYIMKTRCRNNAGIYRIIEIESLLTAGSAGDTVWFTIPSDSTICTEVFFDIITHIADSSDVVARLSLGVTYQAVVFMDAK